MSPTKEFIVICGAGGHGKVVADAVEKQGIYTIAGFLDDQKTGEVFGYPILGTCADFSILSKKGIMSVAMGIGHAQARQELYARARDAGLLLPVIIHPSAQVARGAEIGSGTVLLPQAVLGVDVRVGRGCIVNTAASVDHDCVLGDFVHIAPGAHLSGGVHIGSATWIGVGSVVREGKKIGEHVLLGAGSVVVDDIPSHWVAYGVPAKPIQRVEQEKEASQD